MPLTVAVIYFSGSGSTHTVAESVIDGAGGTATVTRHRITGAEIEAGRFRNEAALALVDAADAVIFGSPTYMGGPAAEFKAFADASSDRWSEQRWADKIASGFTTGTSTNGDQGETIGYFATLAAQHAMLWCSLGQPAMTNAAGEDPIALNIGLSVTITGEVIKDADHALARYFGQRVAAQTARMSGADQGSN